MSLAFDMAMQENGEDEVVDDASADDNNGICSANTSARAVAGPGGSLASALNLDGASVELDAAITVDPIGGTPFTFQFLGKRPNTTDQAWILSPDRKSTR